MLTPTEAESLLGDLCVKLGFCLSHEHQERLIRNPPGDPYAFTDAVLRAEGFDPATTDPHLRHEVLSMVAGAMRAGAGTCEHCGHGFRYRLVHNGFNESCYAYCADCGMTALLDTGYKDRASEGLPRHRGITPGGERFITPCPCGGRFAPGASPRCPRCREPLSPIVAASWIAQAPGTSKGWCWQGSWDGLYSIIIDERVVTNPWSSEGVP